MEKTFAQMKLNVGNMVMATDTTFAVLIGGWLNDGYQDAWRRHLWSASINNDYTITLVSGTAPYDLPADFEDETNVTDITDGFPLVRYNEGNWWQERGGAYSGGSITRGTATRYVILREKMKVATTGYGVIQFDPTPNNIHTIAMPYKRVCNKLISVSGTCTTNTTGKVIASAEFFITDGVKPGHILKNTTDSTYGRVATVDSEVQLTMDWDVCPDGNETFEINTYAEIAGIETVIECYACSQAEAYKKQYQKAMYWGNRYEQELGKRISQENSKYNQRYQWIPGRSQAQNNMPFTGWNSYDSL